MFDIQANHPRFLV